MPELHGIISVHEYTYDSEGRLIMDNVLYDTSRMDTWVDIGVTCRVYTYTYDSMGNKIGVDIMDDDGEERFCESYTYDERGNLIEKTVYDEGSIIIERELRYVYFDMTEESNEIFERVLENFMK